MWESLAQTPTRTSTGHLECYFLSSSPSKNIQPFHLFYLNTAQQTLNFFSHGFYCIFFPKAFKFFCCVCEPGLICHAIFKKYKANTSWMARGEKLLIYILKANGIRRVHLGGEKFVVYFSFEATEYFCSN